MITATLSALAVVFMILRSFPQYIRIVMKNDRQGVSTSTWMLALANHTAWAVYGALSAVPLLWVTNSIAVIGCGATVWVMSSRLSAIGVTALSAAVAAGIFAFSEAALLVGVIVIAIAMFLPQLVKSFRANPRGISISAWVFAALSSMVWIGWGFSIDRVHVVTAHFIMLPASLTILYRILRAKSAHEKDVDVREPAVDVESAI